MPAHSNMPRATKAKDRALNRALVPGNFSFLNLASILLLLSLLRKQLLIASL
jgi:hypothetical protein